MLGGRRDGPGPRRTHCVCQIPRHRRYNCSVVRAAADKARKVGKNVDKYVVSRLAGTPQDELRAGAR